MTSRARVAAAVAVVAAFAAYLWIQPGGSGPAAVVSDLGLLVSATCAGVAGLRRASAGGASRRAWQLIGLSALSWATAQSIWTFHELVLGHDVPFPSTADVFYVGALVCGIAGLFHFPSAPQRFPDRARAMVDGLLIAGALLFVAWDVVVQNVMTAAPFGEPWVDALTLSYPLGHVAQMSILLLVVARARRGSTSLSLLGAGLGVLAVTESVYALAIAEGTYRTGSPVDAGWLIAFALIALAASHVDASEDEAVEPSGVRVMLPYLPIAVVGTLFAFGVANGGSVEGFQMWSGGAIFVFVAIRQVLTHVENVRLTRDLERQRDVLAAREHQLREAQVLADLGSWEIDVDTGAVSASDNLFRLWGLAPGEVSLDVFRAMVHPEDLDLFDRALADVQNGDEPASMEFRFIRSDGALRWCQARFGLVRDTTGRPMAIRGTSQDVTDRREAEQQIRFQARLLDAVGQAVVAVDSDRVVTYWNRAAEDLYRWTAAEALGRRTPELMAAEPRRATTEEIAAELRAGRCWSGEFRIQRPDGTEFPALTTSAPVLDDRGHLIGMIGATSDITEWKAAEEALRRSEERLRNVVEAAPLAIIEFDAHGVVQFWNGTAQALYDWARPAVEDRRPPFTTPDGTGSVDRLFRRVLAGEEIHNEELVRRTENGGSSTVSVSMAPLRGHDGAIVGVTSAALDITVQRRLESELRQAQKMEAVGRLAGGIAHDFNNILTVIVGYGELLLTELDPRSPVTERIQAMYDAARRAAELTDQLLTFSRRHVVDGGMIDLDEVVGSMQPILERLVGEDIDLRVSRCGGELRVTADRSQVQQILLNLVVNARDAMPRGGVLTITTASAGGTSGPATASLEVTDDGTGMQEAVQAHIFEPFFTTKRGEGTGLGLSTVYGIVRQHGGNIDVVSHPGAGSRFTVTLPLVAATGAALDGTAAAAPAAAPTGTILLVEDEATVRALAREILEVHGHTVLEASDGIEGLRLADAYDGPIDVLLTDVVLPQLAGPDLFDRLRVTRPGLRVVFMSGYSENRLEGVTDRDARFLAKPFRTSDLAVTVGEAVGEAVAAA